MDTWWRERRPAARGLFAQELADVLTLVTRTPGVGTTYRTSSGKTLRRVLMPKTKNHVYFEVDLARDQVIVHAVWVRLAGVGRTCSRRARRRGTPRGGPRLMPPPVPPGTRAAPRRARDPVPMPPEPTRTRRAEPTLADSASRRYTIAVDAAAALGDIRATRRQAGSPTSRTLATACGNGESSRETSATPSRPPRPVGVRTTTAGESTASTSPATS